MSSELNATRRQAAQLLSSLVDPGTSYGEQVFSNLYPIDGQWKSEPVKVPSQPRVVAFDMRLANLETVDTSNAAFEVRTPQPPRLTDVQCSLS